MDCYPNQLATDDGPRCADCTSYPLSFHDHVKFCRTVMDTVSFFSPACDKQAERSRPPDANVERLKLLQGRKMLENLSLRLHAGMDSVRAHAAENADLEAYRSGKHDRLLSHRHEGMIYFVRCGTFVKVGFTRDTIKKRIIGLRNGNPFDLTLIGMCPGDFSLERWFHKELSQFHHRMEWFRMDRGFVPRVRFLIGKLGGEFFEEKARARTEPQSTPV